MHSEDDDELKQRAPTLQQRVLLDRHTASQAKVEKSVLIMKETLWKNNLNFVKDVPMIYVSLIIIVVIVSEKKIGGITFVPPLVLVCKLPGGLQRMA
jgi:hypothetical protein